MAIRATPDNLSLDYPSGAPVPEGRVADFAAVWAHRESLRQACTRMIGDPARAEDLVQETFLSAIKSGRRLEPRDSMGPWLATVARRRSIDELRGRRWVAVVPTPPEPAPTILDDPAEQFLSQELVTQLRTAIAELTPRERQLLLRQATYGLSLSDLAAEEETSVASVRSVLTRARQKVRTSLERGGALGGLPIPRWLLNLRDKAMRSAYLWEPTLPSLTGAGAQAVVAIAAAVAMLIGGMTSSHAPEHSLTMIGNDSAATAPLGGAAGGGAGGTHGRGSSGASEADGNDALETPAAPKAAGFAPIPDGISVPDLPVPDSDDPSGAYIHSVVVADDGKTILMGTTAASTPRLLRSFDGGHTWGTVGNNSAEDMQGHRTYRNGKLLVAPGYPADPHVYVKSVGVVQMSEDGGRTFTWVMPAAGQAVLSPNFSAGDPVLYTSGSPAMAYRTDRTFQPLSPMDPLFGGGGGISPGPNYGTNRELLIGGTTDRGSGKVSTVYGCTTTGCTARGTLPGATSSPEVLASKSRPGWVFAWAQAPTGMTLFRSTNNGLTFSTVSLPSGVAFHKFVESNGQMFLSGVPAGSGAGSMLYKTPDGGGTWTPIGTGTVLQKEGVADIIALPNGTILAAPRIAPGLFCSTDAGLTWGPRCPPL